MTFRSFFMLFMLCSALYSTVVINAKTLNIAVASNFSPVAKKLAKQYHQQTGINIKISSGSTGKLLTQIQNGAPYDIFLSADSDGPELLIKQGKAVADSFIVYTRGQLALISRIALQDPTRLPFLNKPPQLAIASAKTAPYGIAAEYWLREVAHWGNNYQLLKGENINQAWHFFSKGGADLALVAYSQIQQTKPNPNKYWLLNIKPELLDQAAVLILKSSANNSGKETQNKAENYSLAQDFLDYLVSVDVQKQILAAGYLQPIAKTK